MKKQNCLLGLIMRILATPFIMGLTLIPVIKLWIKLVINWLKYGGEVIRYDKNEYKNIQDIYNLLKEQNKKPE